MPKLLSGQVLREGGSGQFISLPAAQPALGPSPSTATGFTLVTTPDGVTSYSNLLGNISFENGVLTAIVPDQNLTINTASTGTGSFVVLAPTTFYNTVVFENTFTFVDIIASGDIKFTKGTNSTAFNNGTLVVTGGVGISDDVFIKGMLDVESTLHARGPVDLTPSGYNVTISPTSSGTVVINPSTVGSIDNIKIGATTPATGKFTTLEVTNNLLVSATVNSTSTTTGALVVNGGVGIAKDLHATNIYGSTVNGSQVFDNGNRVVTRVNVGPGLSSTFNGPTVNLTNTGVLSLTAGTGTYVSNTTGDVVVWTYGNSLQAVTEVGNTTTLPIYFNSTTNSTSTTTGAVVIKGGLGVGNDIYVGGSIYSVNLTPNIVRSNQAIFTSTQITGLQASTATISNNALYVAGGAGIQTDLTVGGNAFVYGNLTVLGTATTVVYSVADVGRKVVALSTSAGPAILSIDSGITVGPISSPFVKILFDGINSWKSTGNILPATSGGYSLGSAGALWSSVYAQSAYVSGGTASANTGTGALVVTGGVGVSGNLNVGNNTTVNGVVRITDATASTSTTTGAFIVNGGIGIGSNAYVGGQVRIRNNTVSTSTNTGALVVAGGAGFAGNVYAANFFNSAGDGYITTSTINQYVVTSLSGGTDTVVTTSSGIVKIWNTSTLQSITNRSSTTTNIITFGNTTNATNSSTGAIVVTGGVGIGKDLYVGGNVIVYGNSTFNGTTTNVLSTNTVYTDNILELHKPSTDVWTINDGKDIGLKFDYFNGSSTAAFLGRTNDTGYLEWYGSGVETTNGSTFTGVYGTFKTGIIRAASGIEATNTLSGTLIVQGGAGIGGNLYAGNIFSNGSQVVTAAYLGTYGVSAIRAGTSTYISTSTGEITIWSSSSLQEVTDQGSTTTNSIFIGNKTASIGTTTGALVVAGGMGIGGDLNVRGSVNAYNLSLSGPIISSELEIGNLTASGDIVSNSTSLTPISILSNINDTSTFFVKNINAGANASGGFAVENNIGSRVELTLSSSTRPFNGYGTGTAYLYISPSISSFNIGDSSPIKLYTQGNTVPTMSLDTTGTVTITSSLALLDNDTDPNPQATLLIESSARSGYSNITLSNTSLAGQSFTIEVGGSNKAGQDGAAVDEGNFTLLDNVAGEYRLVVAKTTGNVLLGKEVDDGINKLQVNGSANFSEVVSANTGSFQSIEITQTSTFRESLLILGTLDVASTATFNGGLISQSTSTFNKTVIIGSSALETSVTPINTTDPTSIDSFDATLYRSAKCLIQLTDGDSFQVTEITLLHDNFGQVFKSEYGIIDTGNPLGEYTAELADGRLTLYFEAYDASTPLEVKVVRTTISV